MVSVVISTRLPLRFVLMFVRLPFGFPKFDVVDFSVFQCTMSRLLHFLLCFVFSMCSILVRFDARSVNASSFCHLLLFAMSRCARIY